MWVKGVPHHFIVDSGSQKNLISEEVIKRLDLPTKLHRIPTPSVGFAKEEIYVSTNNVIFPTTSSLSKMRYCVIFLPLNSVMLF
jgi:hypothetical protein